ncbi:hypothetical protein [Streptomyces sp. HB2AG]|uniref:hypothetical protein n=1 Tax=Streptomyces sp. HB2AG TaxID=2983400 RepID=UPI0022AB25AD|nr:hypothetical protein [Streptomyces sp. HB2AG]MCZ2524852.1 hypothetical protein [Streptomyces sp. HB2AG]
MSQSDENAPGTRVEFKVPEEFHEFPLHLPPDLTDRYVEELAGEIWVNGTDFQRETTAACYRELVDGLSADGVLHASLGLFSTEEDRLSIANLIVRIEELRPAPPEVAAAGLHEALSLSPHRDVHRVDLPCGPAVVSFHALEVGAGEAGPGIPFVQIELYVPSNDGEFLVVFALSTPSIAELPVYVDLMSQIGETVAFVRDRGEPAGRNDGRGPLAPRSSVEADVRSVFG